MSFSLIVFNGTYCVSVKKVIGIDHRLFEIVVEYLSKYVIVTIMLNDWTMPIIGLR